jgi:hypothetical protein
LGNHHLLIDLGKFNLHVLGAQRRPRDIEGLIQDLATLERVLGSDGWPIRVDLEALGLLPRQLLHALIRPLLLILLDTLVELYFPRDLLRLLRPLHRVILVDYHVVGVARKITREN